MPPASLCPPGTKAQCPQRSPGATQASAGHVLWPGRMPLYTVQTPLTPAGDSLPLQSALLWGKSECLPPCPLRPLRSLLGSRACQLGTTLTKLYVPSWVGIIMKVTAPRGSPALGRDQTPALEVPCFRWSASTPLCPVAKQGALMGSPATASSGWDPAPVNE